MEAQIVVDIFNWSWPVVGMIACVIMAVVLIREIVRLWK